MAGPSPVRFLLVTIVTLTAVTAAAERPRGGRGKPRLAVLGLTAPHVDDQLVLALEDVISVEAQAASDMDVSTAADTKAFLTLSQQKQLLGCSEDQCLGQFAAVLDVQKYISGSVNKIGTRSLVALQLIDVVNGRALQRVSQESESSPEALVLTTRRLVPGLFGVVGKIAVWNQPEQATMYLNGRPLGRTPLDVVAVRTPGKHTIEIMGPAVTPWKSEVDISPGVEVRLRALNQSFVDLEREAAARRAWGWGLIGAGALVLGGAGGLYVGARTSDSRLGALDLRRARQSELDGITGATTGFFIGSIVAAVVGASSAAVGAWLLADNPAARTLAHGTAR